MIRQLAALPLLWGSLLAETASQQAIVHDNSTPISFGLFISGIIGTAALVWWAGRERQKYDMRMAEMRSQLAGMNDRLVSLESLETNRG